LLIPRLLSDFHFAGLAMLLTVLFVVGTMAQRNELTAALAAGISLFRIMRAPALFAVALSLALLALAELAGPSARRQALAIENEYLGGPGDPADARREPVSWADLAGGWTCHVAKFNRIARSGEEVLMLAHHEGTEEQIRAARIYWDPNARAWMFEDGLWAVFYTDQGTPVTKRRITLERAPIVATPDELFAPMEEPSVRSWDELLALIRDGVSRGVPVARLQVEWYGRFAGAAMPFVMLWVAIPLAGRIRRSGRAASVALAIGLGLAYIVIGGTSQNIGMSGRVNPLVAVWSTNTLFLVVGAFLYRRLPT
jgi:lipopolysaccharide export LptBFGC system permease protein LptF